MGIGRRHALEKIESFSQEIERHIEKMRAEPFAPAYNHWRREIRGWIVQVGILSRHVGIKTETEVAARVKKWKAQIGD